MNMVLFGKRLRAQREKKKITQTALAEKVHCSPSYISHLENGTKCMSFDFFVMLINALEISADELLYENLPHTTAIYNRAIDNTLSDCTPYEAAILYDLILALKQSLRSYKELEHTQEALFKKRT